MGRLALGAKWSLEELQCLSHCCHSASVMISVTALHFHSHLHSWMDVCTACYQRCQSKTQSLETVTLVEKAIKGSVLFGGIRYGIPREQNNY